MKYLSAQPQSPYFLWQLKVQMSNFREIGIENDAIILVGYKDRVDPEFEKFANQTKASLVFLQDKRSEIIYVSSIRPHIMKNVDIWDDYDVMYHDSDILFNRELNLSGEKAILSNTKSYIGAKYIKSKSDQLFERMCSAVGVDPELVISKEESSGGAQYWFPKGKISTEFWYKVELDSEELFKMMSESRTIYSKHDPIQAWTADMWAILWNLWLFGVDTEISSEMDFTWSIEPIDHYEKKPIFHLAGITEKDKNIHFFKGDFINKTPFFQKLNNVDGFCYNRYIDQIRVAEKMFG